MYARDIGDFFIATKSAGAVNLGDVCMIHGLNVTSQDISVCNIYCEVVEGEHKGQRGLCWSTRDALVIRSYPNYRKNLMLWLDKG